MKIFKNVTWNISCPYDLGTKTLWSCTNARRHSKHGTRNRVQKLKQIYKTLIKRLNFDDSDEIEIRLPYCWTALTFWNTSGSYLTQTFNSLTLVGDL